MKRDSIYPDVTLGQTTDQTVTQTGETRAADGARKAQAMHAQRTAEVDRQTQRADDRRTAAAERAGAADTRRTDRQTQRAAWKAARKARSAA